MKNLFSGVKIIFSSPQNKLSGVNNVDEEFELPSRSAASGDDFIDLKKLKKEKSKKVSVYIL